MQVTKRDARLAMNLESYRDIIQLVRRRSFLPFLVFAVPALAIEPDADAIRGKLSVGSDNAPSVRTSNGRTVLLTGDDPTMLVLRDSRLTGSELEAHGHTTAPNQFTIDKIHTRSLFVSQEGKKRMITYWCDVCYIRTFSPGKCWCCQDETRLDLIDPDKVDKS